MTTPHHAFALSNPSQGGRFDGCFFKQCVDGSSGGAHTPVFNDKNNTDISAHDSDVDLIAKALTQMSIGERSRVYESIHGVEEIKDEDNPEHILELQNQLKQEIYRLVEDPNGSSQLNGLNFAMQLNEEYVLEPKQLLSFLRSDSYNPVKAAGRVSRFFDWKLELWGIDKLTQDIVWGDLSKEEMRWFKLGYAPSLPTRDQAGREVRVHLQFMNQETPDNLEALARVVFYGGKPVEESEKSGIVLIALYLGGFQWDRFNPKELKVYSRMMECLPIKIASIHQCYVGNKSPVLTSLLQTFLALTDEETRARVKIHQGSYTEICYSLMSFGIPYKTIPLTHDRKLKTKYHHELIRMRQTREKYMAAGSSTLMLELPLNSDVLLGKGVPIQSHPGNVYLLAVVDENVDKYHAMTNRKDKTKFTKDIVTWLKRASVRFLSKENGVWMEVDDGIAREKVLTLLSSRKSLAKKVDLESIEAFPPSATAHAKPSQPKQTEPKQTDSKRFKSFTLD